MEDQLKISPPLFDKNLHFVILITEITPSKLKSLQYPFFIYKFKLITRNQNLRIFNNHS